MILKLKKAIKDTNLRTQLRLRESSNYVQAEFIKFIEWEINKSQCAENI